VKGDMREPIYKQIRRAPSTSRSEGAVIPLRQAGPRRPTPSTLHADDAFPGREIGWNFPR